MNSKISFNPLSALGLTSYLLVVFGPFLVLSVELCKSLPLHPDWFILALPSGRTLTLLLNSLGLALAVSLSAIIFGLCIASFLWRWNRGLLKYLRWLALVLLPIPPYIHALAWLAAGRLGGWVASWWVEFMSYLPLAIGLSILSLDSVEPYLVDAGRLLKPDTSVFNKVVLPHALPTLVAALGILFLLSLADYSIPSLFSVNVYSLEIFAEYSASNEPVRALLLSLPILLIATVVAGSFLGTIRNAALSLTRPHRINVSGFRFSAVFKWIIYFSLFLAAVQIVFPIVSLCIASGSLKNVLYAIASSRNEIVFSFWIACMAAFLAVPLSLALAQRLKEAGNSLSWWSLVILPLVLPASLVGIGLIIMATKYNLNSFYGSIWMPVLAALSRFAPLAVVIILARLKRIDDTLMDAKNMYQRNEFVGWFAIKFPMILPGIIFASCLVFILSLGELAATIIVTPPGHSTLTIKIYNYLHYGSSGEVAGLCLLVATIVLTMGLFAVLFLLARRYLIKRIG